MMRFFNRKSQTARTELAKRLVESIKHHERRDRKGWT